MFQVSSRLKGSEAQGLLYEATVQHSRDEACKMLPPLLGDRPAANSLFHQWLTFSCGSSRCAHNKHRHRSQQEVAATSGQCHHVSCSDELHLKLVVEAGVTDCP